MANKLFGLLLMMASMGVSANGHHYGHHHGGNWWVAPAIIGGAAIVGGALYQHRQQPPPIYQPQMPPYGYHFETIVDYNCNCYRTVLVPNY